MLQKLNSRKADLLVILIILLAGLKYTFMLEKGLDISLYDEASYLYGGIKLPVEGLPRTDYAPLYAIWYFIISLIEPNKVNLFYLNIKLMTILPPVLVYILLRKNRVSIPVSSTISWFFLLSRANGYTWPKVSHFALLVILIILILVTRRSLLWTSLYASLGALVVSYIRPEFFMAYLLSLLLFILTAVLGKQERIRLPSLLWYLLVTIILLGVFGLPVSADRSIIAFGQHFSRNWVSWTGSNLNPWTNWAEIVAQNFGTADNVLSAFINNPSIFLKHILYNLLELIRNASTLILPTFFPKGKISFYIAALSIIGLCIAKRSTIRNNFREYKNIIMFMGLFILPGLVSTIIIQPRNHYLLLPCVLTAVFLAIMVDSNEHENKQANYTSLLFLGLLAISFTPYFADRIRSDRPGPNLASIRFIQSLSIEDPVNLLEVEGGYHYYLDNNFHRVAEYEKKSDFFYFMEEKKINMIMVSDSLVEDSRFRDDTEWLFFLENYSTFEYTQMDVPYTGRILLIRNDLLK
jgi:hypothetical protein